MGKCLADCLSLDLVKASSWRKALDGGLADVGLGGKYRAALMPEVIDDRRLVACLLFAGKARRSIAVSSGIAVQRLS